MVKHRDENPGIQEFCDNYCSDRGCEDGITELPARWNRYKIYATGPKIQNWQPVPATGLIGPVLNVAFYYYPSFMSCSEDGFVKLGSVAGWFD